MEVFLFTFGPVTRLIGMVVVYIPSVVGNMLSHIELAISIPMTNLLEIFLNGVVLHVARVLSCMVRMQCYISGTLLSSPTVSSLVLSYFSSSPIISKSFPSF